jgi:hypothetical protein
MNVHFFFPPRPRQPLAPDVIVEMLRQRTGEANQLLAAGKLRPLSDGWQGPIIGLMNNVTNGQRRLVSKFLLGKSSSKEFTVGEWIALYCWLFPHGLNECPE